MENDVIIFNQVSKQYGDYLAINNISLQIKTGELVFLAGSSGAGKSTLLKLIAGIELPTLGSIKINGLDMSKLNQQYRTYIRQNIGFVFQDHKILFDRSVFDNVRLPLDIVGYSEKQIKQRVTSTLEAVGLSDKLKQHPKALSGGEQQRLCIARAVVHQPKILIADEPTANLDRDNSLKILELFKTFHQSGLTILISAHDETILNDYGKRIIRINQGQFKG